MRRANAALMALILMFAASGRSATGQPASDDVHKKLDALTKRLEQQEKLLEAQGQKIKQQDEKIRQQEETIHELQKGPGESRLTAKQEKQVEQIMEQYLGKEETRISLGLNQVTAGYRNGFFLATRDGANEVRFTGYVQLDGRFPMDTPTPDTFLLRRVRPTIDGTVAKHYHFKFQPDFGEGKTRLLDAFLDLGYFEDLSTTRLGKFKVPQNLEQLASSSNLTFVERSLVANIVPDRDVGVMMYGKPWKGAVEYSVGMWNGNDRAEWLDRGKDSDVDNNEAFDFGARLQLQPLKNTNSFWLKGLQAAGWFNAGQEEDAYKLGSGKSVLSYRTGPGTAFFKTYSGSSAVYAVRQDGLRTRVGYDAAWLVGPVKVTHDFVVTNTQLARQDVAEGPFIRRNIPTTAWQIGASWVVTGEEASHKDIQPRNPFDPRKNAWGAFELAARFSRLEVGHEAFDGPVNLSREGFAAAGGASGASDVTLGVNWYLNNNVKLTLNWVHTSFDDDIEVGSTSGTGRTRTNVREEDAVMVRGQLRW